MPSLHRPRSSGQHPWSSGPPSSAAQSFATEYLKWVGDNEWIKDAACGRMTSAANWWFAEQGTADKMPSAMRNAIFVCWNKCAVRRECLQHALDKPETGGIWGGAIPYDRQKGKVYEVANELALNRAQRERLVGPREEGVA